MIQQTEDASAIGAVYLAMQALGMDIEAIHTFEGTETMQTLIVGREITGLSAFT